MLPWRVRSRRWREALGRPAVGTRILPIACATLLVAGIVAIGPAGDDGDKDGSDPQAAGEVTAGTSAEASGELGGEAEATATTVVGEGPDAGGSTGAGSDASGGSAGNGSTPGQAGGGNVPAAGTPAAAPGCANARLTATDQGVTAQNVKIGFLIPNLNELQALGFNVGLQGDYGKIIDAWVNELNQRRGGVGCRKVTAVKEVFDVLSVDDMLAKCKAMTEDHKVFSVMTPGGYDSVAQLCIAKDHKTPFINPEPEPEGWYKQAAPYLWNMLMTKDRTHRNHVRWLMEAKQIKPGDPNKGATRVGVVYHAIPNVGPSVEDALLPELKKHGVNPVEVAKLSSDDEQAVAQINQVVLQFQRANVQYVFMPMNLIFKTQFMQVAEQQRYEPVYTDSDHYFGCFDFVTATYPAKSWDRTKCVSSLEVNGMKPAELRSYADNHPYTKYADGVYLRTHKTGYREGGDKSQDEADVQRALHIGMGSQILLWEQAADRLGTNLTRPGWGAEMGKTGAFKDFPAPHPLTFSPTKWDGPDYITVVEWHAEAGNGYEERQYRRLVAPFRAYY